MAFDKSLYEKSVSRLFEKQPLRKNPKNQIIFYQGDPLTNICLIKKGFVKAYMVLESGETRTLFLLGPGDIFPIAFSLDLDWSNYHVKYFYQTLSDVQLLVADPKVFKKSIDTNSDLMNIFLGYMSATNESIINQLEMMKTKGARSRLAYLLPYLVKKLGEPIGGTTYKLSFRISHQEIADLTGLTRETTTQQIKRLETEGAIEQKKGTWIVNLDAVSEKLLRG